MIQKTKIELILQGLLQLDERSSNAQNINMQYLNESMKIHMDDREMHLLEQELLLNEYIVKKNGRLYITSEGKKALHGEAISVQLNTLQIQERFIRYNTLENTHNDNLLIRLLVVTILLVIIGLIAGLT